VTERLSRHHQNPEPHVRPRTNDVARSEEFSSAPSQLVNVVGTSAAAVDANINIALNKLGQARPVGAEGGEKPPATDDCVRVASSLNVLIFRQPYK